MRTPSKSAAVRRARARIHWKPVACIAFQRHGGSPQSCPVSLKASGGHADGGVEHELLPCGSTRRGCRPTP